MNFKFIKLDQIILVIQKKINSFVLFEILKKSRYLNVIREAQVRINKSPLIFARLDSPEVEKPKTNHTVIHT